MIGQTIAGYEVLGEIGVGGMGVVYKARHTRLQRLVALKLLRPEKGSDSDRRRRFLREAQAASALNHPGIVTIHDIVTHDGADVIVMELVEGEPLHRRIPPEGLPWRETAELAIELCEAVAVAHEAGIVHRDLKPANVVVTVGDESVPGRAPRGRVKVLDFGIAKLMPGQDTSGDDPRSSDGDAGTTVSKLTRLGVQPGTPGYMAPEQLLGEPVDKRADVFSFGLLIYEMVTGGRPFRGHNPVALADAILHGDPQPVRELRPNVPAALAALIDKALAKQPAKRHQSMDEIRAVLRSILSAGTTAESGEMIEGVSLKTLVAGEWVAGSLSENSDDRVSRLPDLAAKYRGREVGTDGGRLWLFELPWEAVRYALAFHRMAAKQAREAGAEVETQVGIHLGEVTVSRGPSAGTEQSEADLGDGDDGTGAWTFDVDEQARLAATHLLSLAGHRQTLLTPAAFDLARRGAVREDEDVEKSGTVARVEALGWLAHGDYVFSGSEVVEVFEVGAVGFAPLSPPAASGDVTRVPTPNKILGWRPAPGLTIPLRPTWVVERKLGEGGFGEVWLANQAKTGERRVFKFCYEAERLRSLQREITVFRLLKEELGERDDIARLIDWNLDKAPYFIESAYTEGGSLVDWAADRGGIAEVVPGERLELIAQVATALEAAHSVGVLHKDVKPANVLITGASRGGSEARPRAILTDFGIGLITDRERLEARGITVLGLTEDDSDDSSTNSGTRLYMAPELLTGRMPTIQSDVYAIGVMLYQVVVGDLDRPLAPGWERDIDDQLLREDIAEFVDGRPRHRPRSALEVAERLRALDQRRAAREAERRARREAEDAESRAREEARRAARRRRAIAVAAAVAAVFIVVVSVLALQAMRARADAEGGRARAEQLIDVLLGDLHDSLEKLGRLDLLEQAARGSQAYFDSLGERHEPSAVTSKRGLTLLNIGDVFLRQGDTESARASFESARGLFENAVASDPTSFELRDGLRRSRLMVGIALQRQGETAAALDVVRAALDEAVDLAALESRDDPSRLGLAECHYWVCVLENQAGNSEAAVAACRTALERLELAGASREVPWRHARLALNSRIQIGGMLRAQMQGDAALEEFRSARSLAERLAVEDPSNAIWPRKLAWIRFQTGLVHFFLRRDGASAFSELEVARSAYLRLSIADPTQTVWREHLADTLDYLGRIDLHRGATRSAIERFDKAVAIVKQLVAEDPSHRTRLGSLARLHQSMGAALTELGDSAAAIESFTAAVDLHGQVAAVAGDDLGPKNLLSWSHVVLGDGYARRGDWQRARREWTRAVEIIEPVIVRSDAIEYRDTHVQALLKLGRVREAKPLVEALLSDGWNDPGFLTLARDVGF